VSHRVIVVDDHPIVRDALVASLVSLGVFDKVETAGSFAELLKRLDGGADYDLLILDLRLTDVSGSEGMVYVRENYPDIPIVIFSGNESTEIIAECFENGVHGYVPKDSPMQIIVNAIRIVLAGGSYIPPTAARLKGLEPTETQVQDLLPQAEQVHFTPKQRQVFDQLMLGMPNKIIASRLDMAEGSVKTHLPSIYQLLRVKNRAQAILKSRQLQIID